MPHPPCPHLPIAAVLPPAPLRSIPFCAGDSPQRAAVKAKAVDEGPMADGGDAVPVDDAEGPQHSEPPSLSPEPKVGAAARRLECRSPPQLDMELVSPEAVRPPRRPSLDKLEALPKSSHAPLPLNDPGSPHSPASLRGPPRGTPGSGSSPATLSPALVAARNQHLSMMPKSALFPSSSPNFSKGGLCTTPEQGSPQAPNGSLRPLLALGSPSPTSTSSPLCPQTAASPEPTSEQELGEATEVGLSFPCLRFDSGGGGGGAPRPAPCRSGTARRRAEWDAWTMRQEGGRGGHLWVFLWILFAFSSGIPALLHKEKEFPPKNKDFGANSTIHNACARLWAVVVGGGGELAQEGPTTEKQGTHC